MSDDESMPKTRVKPDNKKAKIDTSKWPLLLKVKQNKNKNYKILNKLPKNKNIILHIIIFTIFPTLFRT